MNNGGDAYTLARELRPGATWLALDRTQRRVVLKALPPDCLRNGDLHPAVRDRLARFRELPLMAFGVLIAVERWNDHVVTVSEFIDGRPLDTLAAADLARQLKTLRHVIAELHDLGLVHGRVHAGNVLIDPSGRLRVVDPSPLLYDDPVADRAALDLLDPPADAPMQVLSDDDAPIRQRTMTAAVVLAAAGVVGAIVLAILFGRSA